MLCGTIISLKYVACDHATFVGNVCIPHYSYNRQGDIWGGANYIIILIPTYSVGGGGGGAKDRQGGANGQYSLLLRDAQRFTVNTLVTKQQLFS